MFRRLQFTFPEGAVFVSCGDQKLLTLQEMMDSWLATRNDGRLCWLANPSIMLRITTQALMKFLCRKDGRLFEGALNKMKTIDSEKI